MMDSRLRVLDLFSGIGGFSLGLERTGGFETVAFCEIEPFCQNILKKHWPRVPCYEDVRTLTGSQLTADGIACDVITGGFPCQDISHAGKQAGIGEGTRSGLWSEIIRLVGDIRPRYVILENTAALLSGPSEKRGEWFGRVLGDLAECGYDAEWQNIPAISLGAIHRRERVWIIAYPSKGECEGRAQKPILRESDLQGEFSGSFKKYGGRPDLPSSRFFGGNDGIPFGLDRVRALGNSVVPQIPEFIGRSIIAYELENQ